jgi:hypothetical protein
MSKPNVPCHECPERHINCHAECDKYKAYKEDNIERVRTIRQGRREDAIVSDHLIKVALKSKRRYHVQ